MTLSQARKSSPAVMLGAPTIAGLPVPTSMASSLFRPSSSWTGACGCERHSTMGDVSPFFLMSSPSSSSSSFEMPGSGLANPAKSLLLSWRGPRLMLQVLSRGDFLRLVGVKSSTLDQRVLTGEAAFALGYRKPAHIGEYLVLDAVAMLLGSMLNRRAGLELKAAVDAVRTNWEGWLELLTKAERFPEPDYPAQCFAVVWLFAPSGLAPRVVMGEPHEIAAAVARESVYTATFISMQFVLRHLRVNANDAKPKIALPDKLTIAPDDKPAYENWRREIAAYQEAAEARFRARATAATKPARAPARKRRLLAT